ncbi:hypothetical protein MSIMFB_05188 [Mycobacterium simulans]|uniref:Uncharacterized protein n=1 Tax=Mycobacterium simulans TaxID=627089 RepID=A0A7Z7ISE5_9MYCO|nr:hypothetical protein MSIMFB_05188 [Mycobacterium simulans]SON60185.1 hypothetical protein MSIMFI_01679 [Mycobacterium simulans]
MWSKPATTSNYARKAVFVSAIGFGLDGFDLLIISFALPGIIVSFHLSAVRAGWFSFGCRTTCRKALAWD